MAVFVPFMDGKINMLLLVNVYFPFPLLWMMLSCSSDVNLRLAYAPWPLPANEIAVGVTQKDERESMKARSIYKVLLVMHVQRHDPFPQIKHGGSWARCFKYLATTRAQNWWVRCSVVLKSTYHPLWAHRYSNTSSLHFDLEHMSPQYPDWL